jgi:glycosyltransferase involved in cell wall biosynthesis
VADGLAHKNHERLLEAWLLLANEDIMPSLVLTVPSDSTKIISKIDILQSRGLNIINIGPQSHEKLQEIYSQSKVLIYPSLIESFGLPLIEASLLNLDVISSELDYVYEVCRPVFTFDPYSPPSIARSVKKYLGLMGDCRLILTPKQFCEIIGENLI